MIYEVKYTKRAVKQLKNMDRSIASFILTYIKEKLVGCSDPRCYGKTLQGELSDKWRYRIGDYRILAKIKDDEVIIVVVEIGHRKDIYE